MHSIGFNLGVLGGVGHQLITWSSIWKKCLWEMESGTASKWNWTVRHSFCPQDGQSRPATITDACPDVHLRRMLRLEFIAWLASSLVAASICTVVSSVKITFLKVVSWFSLPHFSLFLFTSLIIWQFLFLWLSIPNHFSTEVWMTPMHRIPQPPSSVAFVAPALWFYHSSSSGLRWSHEFGQST